KCNKPIIYDFRTADLVLGGQGAPLIPIVDDFLLRQKDTSVIALNMGGIANLTFLPSRFSDKNIKAWDTGPANTLVDKAVMGFTQGHKFYDEDGNYARKGKINTDLLQLMMEHEFLIKSPPKSAGQEQFGFAYYEKLKQEVNPVSNDEWLSFIRTVTEFTVKSISKDILDLIKLADHPTSIIVSGGGAENTFIMERLKEELEDCNIIKFDLPGITSEIKEAFGFAYLGYLFLRDLPGNIPSVTGASRPCVLGKIVF
ncbi:MAG: anhydro-N-acetylmuramic acid kinase, partial [Candidatus Marinimicrobia bacterium]|nr:anhydro-N-acetylmuramic acid kinase [Candidatus Neomarinimicrobiota bacterium]